jgi:hypothetical protein
MNPAYPESASKLDVQLDQIKSTLRDKNVEARPSFLGNGDLDFLYEHGSVLVRDRYLSQVRDIVGGGWSRERFLDGVTLYSLTGARIGDVIPALEAIEANLGTGVATPTPGCSTTQPPTHGSSVPTGNRTTSPAHTQTARWQALSLNTRSSNGWTRD